jgi:hypothetical protein
MVCALDAVGVALVLHLFDSLSLIAFDSIAGLVSCSKLMLAALSLL